MMIIDYTNNNFVLHMYLYILVWGIVLHMLWNLVGWVGIFSTTIAGVSFIICGKLYFRIFFREFVFSSDKDCDAYKEALNAASKKRR